MNLARNTVRQALRSDLDDEGYQRREQPHPKLGEYIKTLEGWLERDAALPRRQRRNARRLYADLCGEGHTGAYDSVQRFVKQWKGQKTPLSQVFIPLSFAPGEAYQFDFSTEEVELGNEVIRVKVAHFTLCHSRMALAVAYPNERLEMVLDAHNRAFAFWGGCPERGIYDNLTTCVSQVLRGKERRFNPRFWALMGHYLVEPVACTLASGWEKGRIENQVKTLREALFVPRIQAKSFGELNQLLLQRCLQRAQRHCHPDDETRTLIEVFQDERPALKGIGAPFMAYSEEERRASSTSLVHFDRNHYSVDCAYAGRAVTVRAFADRVIILAEGTVQGEHARLFGRNKVAYNPWHYLSALERKPGALRNGAPFKDWNLPAPVQRLRDCLLKRPGGDREFVSILCAAQQDLDSIVVACDLALQQKTPSAAMVLNLLHRLREALPPANVATPETLQLRTPPQADLKRYDALLSQKEVSHAAP